MCLEFAHPIIPIYLWNNSKKVLVVNNNKYLPHVIDIIIFGISVPDKPNNNRLAHQYPILEQKDAVCAEITRVLELSKCTNLYLFILKHINIYIISCLMSYILSDQIIHDRTIHVYT